MYLNEWNDNGKHTNKEYNKTLPHLFFSSLPYSLLLSLSLSYPVLLALPLSHLFRRKHEGKEEGIPAGTKVNWKFLMS